MTGLVTLEDAKLHLRVTHDDEDATIALMVAAASEAVRDIVAEIAEDVPVRVKLAVLTRVAIMFDNRDRLDPGTGEMLMLAPLRTLDI